MTVTYILFTIAKYNTIVYYSFLVYCRELVPGTVSLTGDRAQGDDSKHDSHYTLHLSYNDLNVYCRELAPGTFSLTCDRAQGDDSKHCAYSNANRKIACVLILSCG